MSHINKCKWFWYACSFCWQPMFHSHVPIDFIGLRVLFITHKNNARFSSTMAQINPKLQCKLSTTVATIQLKSILHARLMPRNGNELKPHGEENVSILLSCRRHGTLVFHYSLTEPGPPFYSHNTFLCSQRRLQTTCPRVISSDLDTFLAARSDSGGRCANLMMCLISSSTWYFHGCGALKGTLKEWRK